MRRQPIAVASGFLFALIFARGPAQAVDRSWINSAGGVYSVGANWNSGVAPGGADNGIFALNSAGGYIVTMNEGANSGGMIVRQDSVTLAPNGSTLNLVGASMGLTLADTATTSRLTVLGPGTVIATAANIGSLATGTGIATLTSGATLTASNFALGVAGTGTMTIGTNAQLNTSGTTQIGSAAGSRGGLTLNNATASWVASTLPIVGSSGAGSINISAGSFTAAGMTLGALASGTGTLTMIGASSSGTFSGTATVGGDGAGSITLAGGAGLAGTGIVLGGAATGNGVMRISQAGWTGSGSVIVGSSGTGSFEAVLSSAVNTNGLVVGNFGGSAGAVAVTNSSGWTSTGAVTVASQGTGSLQLRSSGTMSAPSATVGALPTGTGHVLIDGTAALTVSGALDIAANGTADVQLAGGGDVNASTMTAGVFGGSAANVVLQGSGTTFNVTNGASIGSSGNAVFSVLADGLMNTGSATLGAFVGSDGSLTVSGGTWSNSATVTIGASGVGRVRVNDGGFVSSGGNLLIGSGSGTGALHLGGQATHWSNGSGVYVGGTTSTANGNGSITIDAGARLTVAPASLLRVYETGRVDLLPGGQLSAGSLQVMTGGAFNFGGGSLAITGANGLTFGAGGPLGASVNLTSGKSIAVTNNATISIGSVVQMSGGTLSTGALVNQGELLLTDRTGLVSGTTVINEGLISGDGRIAGTLSNTNTGEIRADAGNQLSFIAPAAAATSAGRINLFGGTVEFTELVNSATGRVTGRGVLAVAGGTQNNGTMTFSAGTTDVLGSVTSNAGGKVIVTGSSVSTFFDDVTNNAASEFRVSTGATAVFLGTVSGLSEFTGGGTKIFEGPASFGRLESAGSTVVESDGDVVADRVRETSLTIFGRARIEPNGTVAGTSVVKELAIAGGATPTGTLDLSNNALVIDHDGASPIATIATQIAHAYNGGSWDRPGITSANANATTHAVGFAERAALASVPAIFGTVDATAVLARLTPYGDADLDSVVNLSDFNRLATNFGQSGKRWSDGDFTYDGIVNLADFNRLAGNFGLSAAPDGPTATDWAALAAVVPEAGLGLPFAAAAGVRALSRRKTR